MARRHAVHRKDVDVPAGAASNAVLPPVVPNPIQQSDTLSEHILKIASTIGGEYAVYNRKEHAK
eukprot:2251696-Pleurochrysis_carterae.AAC.1